MKTDRLCLATIAMVVGGVAAAKALADQTSQGFDLSASIARGKTVYNSQCVTCHQEKGDGVKDVYPPLAKSDYLMADKTRSIGIVVNGASGEIVVNGVKYDGEMLSVDLPDEQVSDVLNYVRNSWGNEGDVVKPEEIAPLEETEIIYSGSILGFLNKNRERTTRPLRRSAGWRVTMKNTYSRRWFFQAGAVVSASLALPARLVSEGKKLVLVFTKSSGFEHDVVKTPGGKPSIVEDAVRTLGNKYGFDVAATKDGRIFDSQEFHKYAAVLFYTTGDLTTVGADQNPPMSPQGKQSLLDAIQGGLGFLGVHAASDTFHTPPDTKDNANRYIAHGEQSDPYLRMLGGEFITHGSTPRLQKANIIINDPKFPGLEGVSSPASLVEEWYSLKDFRTDLHVILTLDTKGMTGEPYQRPPYPMTWARMEGKGRVFYTAIGDRPENWSNPFFLNVLGGGIRWALGDAQASLTQNLMEVAPGYAVIPPKPMRKST